jgi:hypothetical protein
MTLLLRQPIGGAAGGLAFEALDAALVVLGCLCQSFDDS